MEVKLEVVRGAKHAALTLRLPTIIGRGGDSKIKLAASTVSRNHCELYEYDGQLVVRDLGSSNGTFVNGHKVDAATFLTAEDELRVGPVTLRPVTLRPISGQEPSTARQTAPPAENLAPESTPVRTSDPTEPNAAALAEPNDDVDGRQPKIDEGDSVLEYSENSNGSFIGITRAEETPAAMDKATVFEGVGDNDRPTVDSGDSALNSFFKNLDT
jgi:predicted component of type VI protein secretion system